MTFEIIKKNYDRGLWNEQQVRVAQQKGVTKFEILIK